MNKFVVVVNKFVVFLLVVFRRIIADRLLSSAWQLTCRGTAGAQVLRTGHVPRLGAAIVCLSGRLVPC